MGLADCLEIQEKGKIALRDFRHSWRCVWGLSSERRRHEILCSVGNGRRSKLPHIYVNRLNSDPAHGSSVVVRHSGHTVCFQRSQLL